MNTQPSKLLKKTLKLPKAYIYVGLLAIFCTVFIAISYFGNDPDPAEVAVSKIENADYSRLPVPLSTEIDVLSKLEAQAGDPAILGKWMKTSVGKLQKQVVVALAGGALNDDGQLADGFSGIGIDRVSFQPRYDQNPIAVRRWQASDSAPVFSGKTSFMDLVSNVLQPWQGASDFRINIKIHSLEMRGKLVVANLVAESSGTTSESTGMQATSIWKSAWTIDENKKLILESIFVQAQEEISASIPGGQLLQDCTASIFQNCETMANQLVYGLDQWSRQLPNMDIVGNHGVAIGDVNRDGLDDIYVCQPHGLPNCLLIQNPDGTVKDISKRSGLDFLDQSHAALMVDIDNDRDQDLVISTDQNLLLLSNLGDGEFQLEHTLPIGCNAHSISAADFDQDGDLDLFLCKHQDVNRHADLLMFPREPDVADDGGRNVLLRNDEGWNFTDATEHCGITNRNSFNSRSAVWHDYDNDGDLDLYVANEFMTDQFYENQDGWLQEISQQVGLTVAARHRSVSVGEFNQDGRLDFFVAADASLAASRGLRRVMTNENSNNRQINVSNMLMGEDQIWLTGEKNDPFNSFFLRAPIFSSESAFSSATADLNNDGLDDVIVTNGYLTRFSSLESDELFYSNLLSNQQGVLTHPPNWQADAAGATPNKIDDAEQDLSVKVAERAHEVSDLIRQGYSFGGKQRNRCYLSIGRLGFANFSALSGVDFADDARAVATTDWDCDGDVDIVMTSRGGPQIRILCNQLPSTNGHLQFDLIGSESNRDAIGARVEVYTAGNEIPLVKSLTAGSGNLSQSSKRLTFGLGNAESIDRVVVTWPTGKTQTFSSVVPNTRYEIEEGNTLIAEKTDQRFELAIRPTPFEGPGSNPPTNKTVFYPRPPLPILQFQPEPNKWITVEPVTDRPMLVVFWKRNSASEKLIQGISVAASQFDAKGADCVAILVDDNQVDEKRQFRYVDEMKQQIGFTFPCGLAAESTKDKLKYLMGEWFNHQQPPRFPLAILIDGKGQACSYYSSENISIGVVLADIESATQPDWKYRTAYSPLGGRWAARYRYAKLNRLRNRLKEVGYLLDADSLSEKTRPQRAFELAQKAIELDSQGDAAESRRFFDVALETDPDCVAAYVGEGNLLRKLSRENVGIDAQAIVKMQRAAEHSFDFAIKLDPLNTDAILGRANIAIDQNRLNEALEQLSDYIEVDPTSWEVHAVIGRLLFHQKKYQAAAKSLVTAFENRPSLPYVAGDLGFLYLKSGQHEEARKFLRLARRLQPSDSNIIRLLAEAEFVTGHFDEAVALFEQVTELDPKQRRAKNVLAWLLATCPYEKHRDGAAAVKIMEPMVDLFGKTSPATLEIYAACFAENGQFEQALTFQQQALDLISSDDAIEHYTEEQMEGLRSRLELYRRKRPYRTANIMQIPIPTFGTQR